MKFKPLLFGVLALFVFASLAHASNAADVPVGTVDEVVQINNVPTSFSDRVAVKAAEAVGQQVPAEFNYLVGDGFIRVKFLDFPTVREVALTDDSSDSQFGVLSYVVEVRNGRVVRAYNGIVTEGSYTAVIAVTNGAATRILDSSSPADQVKQEMANSNLKYRPLGFNGVKFEVLKVVGGLLGLISSDAANALQYLQGMA